MKSARTRPDLRETLAVTESSFQLSGDPNVARVFRPLRGVAAAALWVLVSVALTSCASSQVARNSANPGLPAASAMTFRPDLTDEQLRQLQLSREVLMSTSTDITDEARRNAASLLIDLGAPESRDVIEQALASTHAPTLHAVLSALLERPADTLLLDATVGALTTAPPEMDDAVAAVLATYGNAGLERVATLAYDKDAPVENRIRAIRALSAFRSKDGLSRLMALLEPERQEPSDITTAVCASAESLTGMRLGNAAKPWRTWWAEFRDKPFAEVLRLTVRRLSDQLAEAELRNARLSELYADALRDIYLLLPKEEQLNRLATDLSNELPTVRQLALDRVDRLLRDQERLPDAVKQALADRLQDTEPGLRKLAARLLDETNFDQLGELIAQALAKETDPAAAQEFLRILAKRPTVTAAQPALRWLTDPAAGASAASLLAQLAHKGQLPEDIADEARTIVRGTVFPSSTPDAPEVAPPPAQARLLAIIGKERDLVQLDTLLMTAPTEVRQAIADGYVLSGRSEPLLAHAADAILYPYCLRAISIGNGQADGEILKRVIALTPPEPQRELWLNEVRNVASKIPADQALAADDMLADVKGIDAKARIQLLQRAVELPVGQLPPAARRAIVLRSAQLLMTVDEPGRALAQLDTLPDPQTDEPVRTMRLRAAVLGGQYDKALEVDADPQEWIALLTQLVNEKSAMAFALQGQIEQRFGAAFDDPTRAAFDAASNLMRSTLGPGPEAPKPEASADASHTDEPATP